MRFIVTENCIHPKISSRRLRYPCPWTANLSAGVKQEAGGGGGAEPGRRRTGGGGTAERMECDSAPLRCVHS